ncbi:hypothetical protein EGT36_23105 [Agrobacterium sp. FDAARGOS_525]|uniref:phage antirepressor KilAC domain-containing protein n=1 Tax=Agrobacterium sp. FDAARGOS_525 TaxID=2420311 RepID=UPI000F67D44A|nr:phage antirepressor KilAC domain-containing protein [Agrobacterium sp. FDAARGOS_525]RSC31509.1 hypothetical protein EGT36_23105 [Agrobacterium sp. FDAARGOS_525]
MSDHRDSTTVPTVSIGNLTIEKVEGEARVEDIVLAKRLGFTDPKSIRRLIKRHATALEQLGKRVTVSRLGLGGTAEVNYLNRKQAIFITAKSETVIATEVTIEIVKRFDDYENGTARQPMTAEDLIRNPEHLLAITQGYALQIADMRRDMTVMQEDVDTLHRITGADDMFGVRETAKLVQMPQNRFVEWLKQNKWAYRQTGSNKLLAYSEKEKAGLCRNVARSYRKDDGTEGVRETLKFYPKGVVAIAKKLNVTVTDADMAAAREQ